MGSQIRTCAHFVWDLVVTGAEALVWLVHVVVVVVHVAFDAWEARAARRDRVLTCPRGHAVPTEGQLYECCACGFRYYGSIWWCENVECDSPATAYVNCPTCTASVRNPTRWGRP